MGNMAFSVGFAVSLLRAPGTLLAPIFMTSGALMVFSIMAYAGPAGGLYQQACGDKQGFLGALYVMAFAFGRPMGALLGGELLSGRPRLLCAAPVVSVALSII